jgi:multicomponent Na+:H+ antiporter subunit F
MIVVVAGLIGLAALLVLVAFRRFPDPADRIVAADAFSSCAIAVALAAAAYSHEAAYVDVAVGFALVAFLATVGWSSALVARARDDTATEQAESGKRGAP